MELTKSNHHPGYTLIELTIVVGLTSLLAISITAITLSSLLSSNRIRNLIQIRQTGDYLINQLQQLIRNAQAINSCSSADNRLVLTGQDGGQTTIYAQSLNNNLLRIASMSGQTTLFLHPDNIPASSFDLTCLPSDTQPNLIKIQLTLTNNSSSNQPLEHPQVNFETSVELRN